MREENCTDADSSLIVFEKNYYHILKVKYILMKMTYIIA